VEVSIGAGCEDAVGELIGIAVGEAGIAVVVAAGARGTLIKPVVAVATAVDANSAVAAACTIAVSVRAEGNIMTGSSSRRGVHVRTDVIMITAAAPAIIISLGIGPCRQFC
jgi:hypothetical protein